MYIFDVNVPGDDGFTILNSLQSSDDKTPTIYTTALSDISSLSAGFEAGADDYIKKLFNPEELLIRIKSRYMKLDTVLTYKNLEYNPLTKALVQDSTTIGLADVLGNIFHELIIQKRKIVVTDVLLDFLEPQNTLKKRYIILQ